MNRTTVSALALLVASGSAFAHEDDPKLLDRKPAFAGAGFAPGTALRQARAGGVQALGSATPGTGALSIRFPATNVHLLSWLSLPSFGASSANDCWGYVSPSGREYALIGLRNGTGIVEITDPADPILIDKVLGPQSLWRDVKIYDHYAYAVSEGGDGIQIIDLDDVDQGSVTYVGNVTTAGTDKTHNVAINEDSGYLYRLGGGNNGLRAYSLANPEAPAFVGSWGSRYVHDAQIVSYTSGPFAGREIAFCCSGFNGGFSQTGLTILDVTNKGNMFVRAQIEYPSNQYSHQAWLSPDRSLLYLNDELDEDGVLTTTTHVFDVADIDDPNYVGTFSNGNQSIGHNLYTKDDLIFEANYRSGLRVFQGVGTAAQEVASFDTWPGDDWENFNGLWSVYPYLPSGVVIGSDMEKGLFVWWVGEALLEFAGAAPPMRLDPAGDTYQVQIQERAPGDLDVGSAALFWDAGAGLVETPLIDLGAGNFEAAFPALDCGTEVAWFIAARSTNGVRWTWPAEAPYTTHHSTVADQQVVWLDEDMETDLGWTVTNTGVALQGAWDRFDPQESPAQPEDDYSPDGTLCWMTGEFEDLSFGSTTLTTDSIDLSAASDPVVSLWTWLNKGTQVLEESDWLRIQVSADGGANWTTLEKIVDPPFHSIASWTYRSYRLADFVELSADMRLRFTARDSGLNGIVEAGIDELRIDDFGCNACSTESYCLTSPNSFGSGALVDASGSFVVADQDLTLTVSGAVPNQLGFFYYGPDATQVPLGDGLRCIDAGALGIFRLLPGGIADPAGAAQKLVDFGSAPAGSGPGALLSGSTWHFQYWYRDPAAGGAGFNFSDGLRIQFCP